MNKSVVFSILMGWLGAASAASAEVWYVNRSGPNGAGTNWATAFTNIQTAVNAAAAGDTILVTNGTYGAIATSNKAVSIQSMNGAAVTIIEGNITTRSATLGTASGHTNTVLSGFLLRNGYSGGSGGGVYGGTLENCTLTGNTAAYGGGAYYSVLIGCVVSNNLATFWGGGVYNSTLRNCTVSRNTANNNGGGAYLGSLSNCIVSGNIAGNVGGGSSGSALNNCVVERNMATNNGGGVSGGTLQNCVVVNNTARNNGGGAVNSTLYNCTLTGNEAAGFGGGSWGGNLTNSIVWGNTAASGTNANHYQSAFYFSCTAPLPVDTYDRGGNIEADPLFGGAASGNFRLQPLSPCIGTGDPAAVRLAADRNGNAMVQYGRANMGALAGASPEVALHAGSVTLGGAGGTTNLAIDANCEWLLETNGLPLWFTVSPANGSGTGTVSVVMEPYAGLDGFRGAQVVFTAANGLQATGTVLQIADALTADIRYVDERSPAAAPDGLSWATAFPDIQAALDDVPAGGGVYVAAGIYSPVSSTNKAVNIRAAFADPALVVIDGGGTGRCATLGGALGETNTVLTGFTLRNGNAETPNGGGAYYGMLNNCMISNNTASYGGGAYGSVLNNCVLFGNSAVYGGGGSLVALYNCTVAGNTADQFGGGVAGADLYNSIIWGNTAATDSNHWGSTFYDSCSSPMPEPQFGFGVNIEADPLFTDAAGGDLRLLPGSPCYNAGNTNHVRLALDMNGVEMIVRSRVNMGAYANVNPLQTSHGVPYAWLEGYGLVPPGSLAETYELAVEADSAKEEPVFLDFVAGTDPTDENSRFKACIGTETDGAEVWWTPDLSPHRTYTVYGKTNITDTTDWMTPTNDAHRFFHVTVAYTNSP